MTVLDQRPIRNLDTITTSSGMTNRTTGLTQITRNSGFYAEGNNTGTSLNEDFQSFTRKELK